ALLESLKKEGVDLVFGYPGGVVLKLYDEIYKMKFPNILTGHEQGAVHAADGYARASGKVGVVIATSGPGAANLITGIATANMDSVPIVCITGQVANPAIGKDSFQEVDVSGLTTPITKHNYLVKDVNDLPRVVKEAFFIARTGRPGPVSIDIAADVFNTEFDFEYPEEINLRGYSGKNPVAVAAVDEAVKAVENCSRPLIFIGGGVTSSDTSEELRKILSRLGCPSTSTLMGLGCIEADTDGFLGFAGMHGSFGANMAIQSCDLLLAIGMRFSDRVTGRVKDFAPNAKIVHFELDPAEVNKNVEVDLKVLGDLRQSLPMFREKLDESPANFAEKFSAWKAEAVEKGLEHPFTWTEEDDEIKPGALISKISSVCDDNTIAVTDVGQHQMWAAQFFKARKPRQFLTSGGLGTMGFGLPAAMGAKLACPDKNVVLFTGDGSIMMNIQELATIADNNIDIKIVIVHNFILGMVGQWQRLFYNHHYSASELKCKRDFVKIANAMGLRGYRLTKAEELEDDLVEIMFSKGAAVIDVYVPEEENVIPMVPGGKRLDQMVLGK
ncbi:MAG: biosynthetic-type acetolactate synthase large subunit, partial [Selenomonadaceae bacterium]|nr:biosynthetic-type acetolactate synthase large subunit [Selenomonadaceae bacterium]